MQKEHLVLVPQAKQLFNFRSIPCVDEPGVANLELVPWLSFGVGKK